MKLRHRPHRKRISSVAAHCYLPECTENNSSAVICWPFSWSTAIDRIAYQNSKCLISQFQDEIRLVMLLLYSKGVEISTGWIFQLFIYYQVVLILQNYFRWFIALLCRKIYVFLLPLQQACMRFEPHAPRQMPNYHGEIISRSVTAFHTLQKVIPNAFDSVYLPFMTSGWCLSSCYFPVFLTVARKYSTGLALLLSISFLIYVHHWLLLILILPIVNVHYMFRSNWPSSSAPVGLWR
jgi:hypothetical protein